MGPYASLPSVGQKGANVRQFLRLTAAGALAAASLALLLTPAAATIALRTGVVTAGDGTPIAGAEVSIFDETGKSAAETTTTAADGSYSMDDCASCVGEMMVTSPGYYLARGGPDFTLYEVPRAHVARASTNTLTFAWDPIPGAVAYRITFADNVTFGHPKIIVRSTATSHAYKALIKGHVYYALVNPIAADGRVIRGDFLQPQRPVAGRPGYVNNLHADTSTSTSITLAWAPFVFASCCTEYQVQLSSSKSFATFRSHWAAPGETTLTFANLAPETAYYVRVRARNASHTYMTPWSGARLVSTS